MRTPSTVFVWLLVGCTAAPSERFEPEPGAAIASDALVLDTHSGRTIGAHPVPTRPHTDEGRVLTLTTDIGGPLGEALEGLAVLDARFVSFGAIVLHADHTLDTYDEGGVRHPLDEDVYGPLSVVGGYAAYTVGGPPDLELVRAHLASGSVETLTVGMAPVWSPALSDDGRAIVFAASPAGQPQLHRWNGDGLVALPPTARIPSAPTAPLLEGATLLFEDEAGVVQIDLESGGVLAALDGAHALRRGVGGPVAELEGRLVPMGGAL